MTRIQYRRIHDGLISAPVNAGEQSYKVKIDFLHMAFTIVDAITGDIAVSGGVATNQKVLMNQARRALVKLGAPLQAEKRRKLKE